MMTKQEFQDECRRKGFRLKDDFYEKFVNHFQSKYEIDDKFFQALQLLTETNGSPTICRVFKVLKHHHDDQNIVNWLCMIGDRMGKRMHNKMVQRKKQIEKLGLE